MEEELLSLIVEEYEVPEKEEKNNASGSIHLKRTVMSDQSREQDSSAKKVKMLESSQDHPRRVGTFLLEEDQLLISLEEHNEQFIMKLLLEANNGTLPQRETVLRHLTKSAEEFGSGPLFNYILQLLMLPKLKDLRDQEIHFLLKVINNVLYKMDGEQVRPFVIKIIVAIQPLLMDDGSYSYMGGREIIFNLSKTAGLDAITSVIGPQMNDDSEYVRNAAAKAFGVVASALGVPAIIPFLKGACQCKESWRVRNTGIRMVEQIAILVGCTLRPHVRSLVEFIEYGLTHEDLNVMRITALSLAALAKATAPCSFENFRSVWDFMCIWHGGARITFYSGEVLAALVKLFNSIISLVDPYLPEIHPILVRYNASTVRSCACALLSEPDEEMKEIALKTLKRLSIEHDDIPEIHGPPDLYRNLWGRTMSIDRKNYELLVAATVAIADRVGVAYLKERIVEDLHDYSKTYRLMVIEIIKKASAYVNVSDGDAQLEDVFQDMDYLFCSSF